MADAKKSQKGQKMSLQEFHASAEYGSWADDVPDLPTAPSREGGPAGGRRGPSAFGDDYRGGFEDRDSRGSGSGFRDRGDRSERPPRQPMPSDATEWRAQRASGPSALQDRRLSSSSAFDSRQPRSSQTTASPSSSSPPPQRLPQKQFPTKPPFTAYVGNLSYECTEAALVKLFDGLAIKSVRLPAEGGQPKGFAYVEFEELESLQDSMSADGHVLLGRGIRVDVAEPS
ncbi:hypothetical protein SeLEV6574_g08481, partial [Synchytrium endobioticum]